MTSVRLRLAVLALLLVAPLTARAQSLPTDSYEAVTRVGVYGDNDRTRVIRYLVAASAPLPKGFLLNAQVAIDTISSASIDVRAAPDAVTRASPTLRPTMVDQRNQYDLGLGWTNGRGAFLALGGTFANEIDYLTVGGSLRGSLELFDRNTTLLGGVVVGRDIITSVVDPDFRRHLTHVGYSVGLAQVLGPRTALRVRYDGGVLRGFQASAYRAVRYGNWTAVPKPGADALTFIDTVAEGGERLPLYRVRHAGTFELVQALIDPLALAPQVMVGHDSWGLTSTAVGFELRLARPRDFRFTAGYRFYYQTGADFYLPKYTGRPEDYELATADKKLGRVMSHSALGAIAYQILERPRRRVALAIDLRGELLHYRYTDFLLLESKTGFYSEVGLRLNF